MLEHDIIIDASSRAGLSHHTDASTTEFTHTMQREGEPVGIWITDAVQANVVGHVRHLVSLIGALALDLQGFLRMFTGRPLIYFFDKSPLEDFHNAMRPGVVVHWRLPTWAPN